MEHLQGIIDRHIHTHLTTVRNAIVAIIAAPIGYKLYHVIRYMMRKRRIAAAMKQLPGDDAHWWYGHLKSVSRI